jgi:methyl-CpG-binding domain protein 4
MIDRDRLLQEDYADTPYGPWKVLVVCQLLNRTTWIQAERALRSIFSKWPSPKSMAFMTVDDMKEFHEILKPLGLSRQRRANLMAMSLQYHAAMDLYAGFRDFPIQLMKGCGAYAEDAWTLFVLKEECDPKDRRLRDYAREHDLLKKERILA